jgi:non-heme chloroperoxidase
VGHRRRHALSDLRRLDGDYRLVVIEGGPHAITWTHADQVNRALLGFLD